uniref:Metal-response element-binding transcription factor 2 n=4 Tax=Lygus hesperus TaxID=30085 RepID=A0A0A9XA67_LYGHE
MSKKKENGTADPVPDSTTKPNFYTDDEVLMQRKDGNFYLGTLIRIDWNKEQALVKFGDDTESWSSFGQLTKLSAGVECVKCKESTVEPSNDILVCESCSQGYHQMCHTPPVTTAELKVGVKWECSSCQEESRKLLVSQRSVSVSPSLSSSPEQVVVPQLKIPDNVATECQRKKLPYNINDLHWDMQRRVNSENKYCYCARSGKWFLQMLQCGRCRQWFHARCIISLRMPLLFGDRFFVFVCSICNAGKEFLRRLEVKWLDLVHLAIFNLTLTKAVKYQDVDDDIVNFINEHWDNLQLPPKMRDTSLPDRRDHVLSMLNANRNRFRYSREMKKRTTMWGLKHRVPPPTPVFSLPPNKPLSDQVLLDAWHNNARLQFLPSPPSVELPSKKYDLYPDWEKNESNLPGLGLLHVGSRPLILPKGVPATGHNSPRESQDLPPTPPSSESNMEAPPNLQDTSGDESSSRGTLDSFIPPPMDFEGRNNPFMTSIPLTLTPIVRPAKRRLSEKDIRITSNGEIKRRRVRRGVKLAGRGGQTTDGLRRMKRPRSGPSTPTASPVKNGHPPSYKPEDLQNTVSSYFGAMNRIASGEKFTIRARRILPNGKTQYLIDWGCSPT